MTDHPYKDYRREMKTTLICNTSEEARDIEERFKRFTNYFSFVTRAAEEDRAQGHVRLQYGEDGALEINVNNICNTAIHSQGLDGTLEAVTMELSGEEGLTVCIGDLVFRVKPQYDEFY